MRFNSQQTRRRVAPTDLDFRAAARWGIWLILPAILIVARGSAGDYYLAAIIGSWALFRLYEPLMERTEDYKLPRYSRVALRWQAVAVISPIVWIPTFHETVAPVVIGSIAVTALAVWRVERLRRRLRQSGGWPEGSSTVSRQVSG